MFRDFFNRNAADQHPGRASFGSDRCNLLKKAGRVRVRGGRGSHLVDRQLPSSLCSSMNTVCAHLCCRRDSPCTRSCTEECPSPRCLVLCRHKPYPGGLLVLHSLSHWSARALTIGITFCLTYCPYKDIKGTILDICSTPKIDQLDSTLTIENNILVFDISVYHSGNSVQMVHRTGHLSERCSYTLPPAYPP